jgi:uncharacterized membrane protein
MATRLIAMHQPAMLHIAYKPPGLALRPPPFHRREGRVANSTGTPGRGDDRMESRLRVANQAVQPVLVMFPLGLFAMAALFDFATLVGAPRILGALAYWNVVAGLAGGILVALAGAIDVMFVSSSAARRVGVLRNLMNMGVLILFAVVLMLRMRTPERVAGGGLFALELLALAGAGYALWYGGELAGRRGAPAALAAAEPQERLS